MRHIISITPEMLPNIGVNPEKILSPGFNLKDFSFTMDLDRGTVEVKAGIEADRGVSSEHCEVQLHKFMVALKAGLKNRVEPVLERHGVGGFDSIFRDNLSVLMEGRKLEIPKNWSDTV
jgi:hypothetical protein